MTNFKFIQIKFIDPTEIRKAGLETPSYDFDSISGAKATRWDKILIKLRGNSVLTQSELRVGLLNADRFEVKDFRAFCQTFEDSIRDETVLRILPIFANTLSPMRTISLLLRLGRVDWNLESNFPPVVNKFSEHFKNGGELLELAIESLSDPSSFEGFFQDISHSRESSGMTIAQNDIFDRICDSDVAGKLILTSNGWLSEVTLQTSFDRKKKIGLLDKCVASYISLNTSQWRTNLLRKCDRLSELCTWCASEFGDVDLKVYAPSISSVLSELHKLKGVLASLSEAAQDRGKYWERKIPDSSGVEVRLFGRALVGLAVTFGNFTVVEFGPSGNSALVYERTIFEKLVRNSSSWRDMGRNINLPGYSSRPDGSVWHIGSWENNFDGMIAHLKKMSRGRM